jgi:hypothetical protein
MAPNDTGNLACSGNPITLPTATGATCAAALETRAHRFVLCSCESMNAPARVRTDAYDSRDAVMVIDEGAGAIGIGGNLVSSAEVRAGGAFYVAGAGGIDASSHIRSERSLRVGGPFTIRNDNADVGTDAYVNGNVTATGGEFRVSRTLHVPPGAVLTGVSAADTLNEAVSVPAPCDCSAGFVDAAGAIAAAAAANANTTINLSPTALATVTAPRRLELPCGVFHLDDIDADASITLVVHGRTLLAISGDVTVRAGLAVELDANAELDLLVAGGLTTRGGSSFGAAAAPARFRVWVAGTSSVTFDGAPAVSAVVHAPAAAVIATSGLPLSGSLLARSVMIGADSLLHYDEAILEAGTVCNEPPAPEVP